MSDNPCPGCYACGDEAAWKVPGAKALLPVTIGNSGCTSCVITSGKEHTTLPQHVYDSLIPDERKPDWWPLVIGDVILYQTEAYIVGNDRRSRGRDTQLGPSEDDIARGGELISRRGKHFPRDRS